MRNGDDGPTVWHILAIYTSPSQSAQRLGMTDFSWVDTTRFIDPRALKCLGQSSPACMRGNCIFSATQFTSLRKRGTRMSRPRFDSRAWSYEKDSPNSLAGTRVILMRLSFKLGFTR